MQITLEIKNETILQCLSGAHSRYWAKTDSLKVFIPAVTNMVRGSVVENYDGINVKHTLDVEQGLRLLSAYSPRRFAELLTGDFDGETGDVFLQLCAGVTYVNSEGVTGPKYG